MTRWLSAFLLSLLLMISQAVAHEARPAYLDLRETSVGQFDVVWKRPMRAELTLSLSIRWPAGCVASFPVRFRAVDGAMVERGQVECGADRRLIGERIAIVGLDATRTDALVRIAFADGTKQTSLVKPDAPEFTVEGPRPLLDVAFTYFALGVAHILSGIDHLLFVFALILIVRSPMLLVKTITAFTVAHSLTLAGATLDLVAIPTAATEAVIALSIVFLASEIIRQQQGKAGLTARAPWLVAFAFGLLHGFGFAGALAEIGLPQTDIPLALLTFNLGVEAGQLLFIAVVLSLLWIAGQLFTAHQRWIPGASAYAIGSLAAIWLIERVAAMG